MPQPPDPMATPAPEATSTPEATAAREAILAARKAVRRNALPEAWRLLREVLSREPGHQEAGALADTVVGHWRRRLQSALRDDDPDAALEAARQLLSSGRHADLAIGGLAEAAPRTLSGDALISELSACIDAAPEASPLWDALAEAIRHGAPSRLSIDAGFRALVRLPGYSPIVLALDETVERFIDAGD